MPLQCTTNHNPSDISSPAGTPNLPLVVSEFASIPAGVTYISSSSGNQANATAQAAIPGVAGKTSYCAGFVITAGGATTGVIVNATLAGATGGTMTFNFATPAGVLLGATPLVVQFIPPLPAVTPNQNILLSLPALGAGNTNAAVVIYGYQI